MDRAASTKLNVLEYMLVDENVEPTDLPLSLLEYITSSFSDDKEIGQGGFSVVYKGMLRNGTIAVKKLLNTHLHEEKFHKEVECLMKAKHKNVVRFLGYCSDTQGKMENYNGKLVMAEVPQRLLCFEYLPKGSLHEYITDAFRELKWTQCYQIIKGICTGLHYLHENCIVHLDLKPANILLDNNMVPKIADFGLSRCFDENQSHAITSKLFGSLGYLAPEVYCGRITFKSDIYSLGVIMIEMLKSEKMYSEDYDVLQNWGNKLETSHREKQLEQLHLCAEIGKECTDYDPRRRPDARTIVDRLHEADIVDIDMSNLSVAQHHAGFPVLPDNPPCYKVFYFCKATGFMASVALIVLLLNKNLYKPWIHCYALIVCMAAGMFGLMGAYAAGSSHHPPSSRRREQDEDEQPLMTTSISMHRAVKFLIVLRILATSMTTVAGLKPPGGFWTTMEDGFHHHHRLAAVEDDEDVRGEQGSSMADAYGHVAGHGGTPGGREWRTSWKC